MPAGDSPVGLIINAREVQAALKRFDADLVKRTRRLMAVESRRVRDEIRSVWKVGPAPGGHSRLAVTSGTKGLIPTIKLRRDYRPYVGWLVFGGTRRRRYPTGVRVDRQRRGETRDGYWFYPGIKRARRRVERQVQGVLRDAIRAAGLD
jgi:hypothetical protein